MKHAFVFPGQGSQFSGMGKTLYEENIAARELFEKANDILGFRISDVMFSGSPEELKQTNVTQPAIFLHSIAAFQALITETPDMVAGHSLGEFTALVANGCLSFENALKLVSVRAGAMQKACDLNPSSMAAVLGLDDGRVEEICASFKEEIVVPANYNCPGQIVISGSIRGIEQACVLLKEAGAKRALILPVGGAFHSPLMDPAREELANAIWQTSFENPICPVYQNVTAHAVTDTAEIKTNLISQLTGPVRWTQSIEQMIFDGAAIFTEVGPGKVLQGLIAKIHKEVQTVGLG
ncbi:MAG: ACP S-malonyltransferase [Ginsengibacter sp.]